MLYLLLLYRVGVLSVLELLLSNSFFHLQVLLEGVRYAALAA